MLRRVLVAAAVVALIAPARAAEPDLSGNWMLVYSVNAGDDRAVAIIKVEIEDGKPVATVIHSRHTKAPSIANFKVVDGKTITFNSDFTTFVGSFSSDFGGRGMPSRFEGTLDAETKIARGSFGRDASPHRAWMIRTDKTEVPPDQAELHPLPEPVAQFLQMIKERNRLRSLANTETDADKKKALSEQLEAFQKESDLKEPGLLREVVAKHGDTLFALDASLWLLSGAAKFRGWVFESPFRLLDQATLP